MIRSLIFRAKADIREWQSRVRSAVRIRLITDIKVQVRVISDPSELDCTSIDWSSFNHNIHYRALFRVTARKVDHSLGPCISALECQTFVP